MGIEWPEGPKEGWAENPEKLRTLPYDPTFKPVYGVHFSGTFTNGTVLQRKTDYGGKAALYGYAPAGSTVKVSMTQEDGSYGTAGTVPATADGAWKWVLPQAMPAGGNYTFIVGCSSCNQTSMLMNVTFGDVWFCSGQSNMELAMKYTMSRNTTWEAYESGKYRNIRILLAEHYNREDHERAWMVPPTKGGQWEIEYNRVTLFKFSAACYYFAQALTERLGDDAPPFGLIGSYVGGTTVETWSMNHTQDHCGMPDGSYNCDKTTYKPYCGSLFNGMVAPFMNTTIKGVVWYQGENNMASYKGNIANNTGYACMLLTMVKNWQKLWSATPGTTDPNFHFGQVTLAGWGDGPMRWAQTQNYGTMPNPALPTSFMAAGHDLADPWAGQKCWGGASGRCAGYDAVVPFSTSKTLYYMGPVHPRVKFELGRRLAQAALSVVYGRKEIQATGPTIASCNYTLQHNIIHIGMQFNMQIMNPKGRYNNGSALLHVESAYTQQYDVSVIQLQFNDTWVPIQLNLNNGKPIADGSYSFQYNLVDGESLPKGIRYAWDMDNSGCCVGLDTGIIPCVPRSCPFFAKFTKDPGQPSDFIGGGDLGLPANPFWAEFTPTSATTGKCKCFEPQVCG